MEIPWQRLSPEALQALVEEFVTREGTDYGQQEFSLAEKTAQVLAQIRQGSVVIRHHPDTRSTGLFPADPPPREGANG